MRPSLDLPPGEFEAAIEEIVAMLREVRNARPSAPVLDHPDPAALARQIRTPLPVEGTPIPGLLREVKERILPWGRRNDSPGFFGYVCSGGSDAGTLADLLASGLNQNVTAWRSAPSATEMERLVLDWLREILGMPEGSGGLLLGGGSPANLTALAAARDAVAGADIPGGGLITLGREMTLYASDEVHMSIPRAASLLGIGREGVRVLPSTDAFLMDMEALRKAVRADREASRVPFCVVANAGSTNTGAVDPLEELARFCRQEGLWLHVDASYGGLAMLAPDGASLLKGLGKADSVAVDPHKWMHVPFDCGALVVRNPSTLRASFSEVGEYARTPETDPRAAHTFFEHGPELSRRFRALKVWMVLKHLGTRALGEMIGQDIRTARYLVGRVESERDLQLLAPVPLSAVCFRYAPPGVPEPALDRANRRILARLQEEGKVYPTHAGIRGLFAIRACILNPRTTEKEMDLLADEVLQHGSEAG